MNTKRSHKIFSLVMLILIVGGLAFGAVVSVYSVYEYKHEQKLKEDAIAAIQAASSEANSETTSEEE